MTTWDNFRMEQEDVEKLIYPLTNGDEYDKGEVNEVLSQIHAFQGSLAKFNDCCSQNANPEALTLPKPTGF